MTTAQIISIVIFLLTMGTIMTEKLHRAVAAVAGGVLLMVFHILSLDDCITYIDFNTLGILVGMMMFVAVVKRCGIFEYIAIKSAKLAKGRPWPIMIAFILITAVLSAFLDNVTTVLLVGPMTIAVTEILDINPVPYLITEMIASNAGGTATLIGDPPNIMIGSARDLGFDDFLINTGVPVIIALAVCIIVFYFLYGQKMHVEQDKIDKVLMLDEKESIKDKRLLILSTGIMLLIVTAFIVHKLLGLDSCAIALTAAAVIMLLGKQDPEEIISEVEWPTIIFFTGLFVVVGGLQKTGIINVLANTLINETKGHTVLLILMILWISAIVSAFLDNIPFVATLIPLLVTMQADGIDTTPLWWALSLGACLGGNGSLIGASANVVLSGMSKKYGHPITFMQYLKIGFPVMILTVIVAMFYLLICYA